MLGFYLIIGTILFLIGLYTCLSRVNAIGILMGVELMLNACGLNFVAFSHFRGKLIDGHIMTLFIIVLAASEVVAALAILMAIRKKFDSIDVTKVDTLKY